MKTINEKMQDEKEEISWFKKHKKKIIVGTGIAVAVIGGIVIYRKWDDIKEFCHEKGLFKKNFDVEKTGEKASDLISNVKKVIPDDFAASGIMMTATDLGREVNCSAQVINKRLIAEGIAKRLPCGLVVATEEGKCLGKSIVKTNRYGYSFENTEWDKNVLLLIFSKEELECLLERKAVMAMELAKSEALYK